MLNMKIRLDKRTILIYIAVILAFLEILFIEPFPIGTSDNYVWDYYQAMVLPAVGSLLLTLIICGFAKGEKWLHSLAIVAIGTVMYVITGMDLGDSFVFSSIFYGFPSFFVVGVYAAFCALGEIGEEHAEEVLKRLEENNTSGF